MSLCVLTHSHVAAWEKTGVRPDCNFHRHISFHKAIREVEKEDAILVPGLKAIVRYPCVEKYVWQGKNSGGYSTLQFAPITPSPIFIAT